MTNMHYSIAPGPHVNSGPGDIPKTMLLVNLALLPALFFGFYLYGLPAVLLTLTCIFGTLSAEMFCQYLRKDSLWRITDFSAVLTGILMAMILPPHISLFLAFLGAWVAIIIGKALFGGIGYNIFNPALVGRAFLGISFPVAMTTWVNPQIVSAVTTATPLALNKWENTTTIIKTLIIGTHSGCMGESSTMLLLLGGIFLIALRIVDFRIPFSILGSTAIFAFISNLVSNGTTGSVMFHLCSGGLMIGAFFMATDMVTSPVTPLGKIIFGMGIGILVMIIRLWGGLPEGVMFCILIFNGLTPLINRHTRPSILGTVRGRGK